jgi:hypothetical protein
VGDPHYPPRPWPQWRWSWGGARIGSATFGAFLPYLILAVTSTFTWISYLPRRLDFRMRIVYRDWRILCCCDTYTTNQRETRERKKHIIFSLISFCQYF